MEESRMTEMIRWMLDDDSYEPFIPYYLELAKAAVVARLYPYVDDAQWQDVPSKYHAQTCEIAVYLINKRGAEGELSHKENGVDRVYETAAIPARFFSGMAPRVGVPR